ncbi:MAG: ABC transporter permease [Planctomycetota bacterium]|nr:MAG: ABC transporter permease [Planctomycetota bacterium]
MTTYIIRRFLHAVLVILILSLVIFLVMRLLPGDPILLLVTSDELALTSDEKIAELRHEFGLDRPLAAQYVTWLGQLVKGDLGTSIIHRDNVKGELFRRLPITLHLGLTAFILGSFIGLVLGILSAIRRDSWIDTFVTMMANLGVAAPPFWFAALLIYLCGVQLNILPVSGYTSPVSDFWMSLKQAIMPILCLAVFPICSTARQTRSSMLEVIHQDYIRTAWAKGLREGIIVMRHAVKNALIPVVTVMGIILRYVVGGSVVIEMVFNIPGLGRLAVDSAVAQDYPVVQGIILLVATIVVMINLVVDLLYGWLDPRTRYE